MIMKIKDLNVGLTVSGLSLAVKSAEIKKAKNGKAYLTADLFDGTDSIKMNVWNYDGWLPSPNDVVDIIASVGQWHDTKQLTGTSIKPSNVSIDTFCPQGEFDIPEYYDRAMKLISEIKNDALREVTEAIYTKLKDKLFVIPAAKGIHNAYMGGTLEHCVDVATTAKSIAQCYKANVDLVIAGGLLHDIGKLWTYFIDATVIDFTMDGHLMDHIPMGAMYVDKYRTPENTKVLKLLEHIILSHHGRLEYGSPVTPKFIEAFIVSEADMIDSRIGIYTSANKDVVSDTTAKVFHLGNQPLVSQVYVKKTLGLLPQE